MWIVATIILQHKYRIFLSSESSIEQSYSRKPRAEQDLECALIKRKELESDQVSVIYRKCKESWNVLSTQQRYNQKNAVCGEFDGTNDMVS